MADPRGRRSRLVTAGATLVGVLGSVAVGATARDTTSLGRAPAGSLAAFDFVVDANDADRWVDPQRFAADVIEAVLTPGHAAHHVSYVLRGARLAG